MLKIFSFFNYNYNREMKFQLRGKYLISTVLIASFFSGCLGRKKASVIISAEHNTCTLAQKIDNRHLSYFFSSPEFEVYEIGKRKSNYEEITVDFYKRPSFGLFTSWGEKRGREFIDEHNYYLNRAVEHFNLSTDAIEIISALAGIEYSWGAQEPPYRTFNSLYSVYLQLPTHKNFALRNIQGLIDGVENPGIKIDAFSPSSFMGAVGYCQLMPMWFTEIGERNLEEKLDLDNNGFFDPFTMPDAIAFFAWYLSENGFGRNQWNAVKLYNGKGPAADAFADAIIEFSEKIRS